MDQLAMAIIWWLLLMALSIAVTPLLDLIGARDHQFLSKPLGLILLTYLTWLPSTIAPLYGKGLVISAFGIIVLFGIVVGWRRGHERRWILDRLEDEAIFSLFYVLFLLFFLQKPDIYPMDCEDFMNYAFIQSILRSTSMPPPDPWLAGMPLSYYYLGHLMFADLVLVTGVPSNIAYNLAAATFPALAASCAYGLGRAINSRTTGVLAIVIIMFSGILSGFYQLLAYLAPWTSQITGWRTYSSPNLWHWLTHMDFYSISVIPQTFNFYPFHTFSHGYLHAFMLSIPFQIALIGLVHSYITRPRGGPLILVWSLFLGFTIGFNSWDYPTYALLSLLAVALFGEVRHWILIVGLSMVLYLPMLINGGPGGFMGIEFVETPSTLTQFLSIFPLFSFVAYSHILEKLQPLKRKSWYLLFLSLGISIVGWTLGGPVLGLLTPIIGLSVILFLRGEGNLTTVLVLLGALVAMGCEVIYIKDAMPWPRFNTIMKFHLQVWVIWGMAAAVTASDLLRRQRQTRVVTLWSMVFIFLLLASLVHPLLTVAVLANEDNRFAQSEVRGTLDGTAYLSIIHPNDAEAIHWLRNHVEGQPVILEAPGSAYSYAGRISTMTGLPTLVGWRSHETIWHTNRTPVNERYRDAEEIFSTYDLMRAEELLDKYGVQFIYIGDVENERYPKESLAKFEEYPVAFQVGNVTIYERRDG